MSFVSEDEYRNSEIIYDRESLLINHNIYELVKEIIPYTECPICSELKSEFIKLIPCNHAFCTNCLDQYLEYLILDGQVVDIKCCHHECQSIILESVLNQLLSGEILEKYNKFINRVKLQSDPNLKWCPSPNCEGYDILQPGTIKLQCAICKTYFCAKCNELWHNTKKCKTDRKFERWASGKHVKACPKCY